MAVDRSILLCVQGGTEEARFSLFARSAFPLIALVVGLMGWLLLVLSAGLAMGSAGDTQIAIPLALAGAVALLGLTFGALGLRHSASGAQSKSVLRWGYS